MQKLKRRSPKSDSVSSVVSGNLKEGHEYEGRLVYVADLGLQERNFKGESKPPAQQISLGIEIIGETVEFDDGTTAPRILFTEPFYVYYELNEKGKELRYYRIFDPADAVEGNEAEWGEQLGKPCNVLVKHTKKDDKIYDNIQTLTAIPKKYQDAVGKAVTEPCIGDADDAENPCTKALYGLAKYVWERRIKEDDQEMEQEVPNYDDELIPF